MTNTWQAPANVLLLNVDITKSFCPGRGKWIDSLLMVNDGDKVVPIVNDLRQHFLKVGFTKEVHPAVNKYFASNHEGKKHLDTIETAYGTQFLWGDHCVEGTDGCEYHPDLIVKPEDIEIIKGRDPEIHAYSAVYMDDRKTPIIYEDGKTLTQQFKDAGIDTVVVTGLAYDFCAGLTAYDLAKEGFNVILVRDASKSIKVPTKDGRTTIDDMDDMLKEAGVKVVSSLGVQMALGLN